MRGVLGAAAAMPLAFWACASTPPPPRPVPAVATATAASAPPRALTRDAIVGALASPGRTEEDRALDEPRHTADLLAFVGVHDGMRVGELGSWMGYTADTLSRVIGPSGHVWAEDPRDFEKWIGKAWLAREERPGFTEHVTHLWRRFDDPFGPEVRDLEAVLSVLFYHDTVWLNVDRARMNRAVLDALVRGGQYVVVDHSARAGDGVTVTEKLHRIEDNSVIAEVTAAGFRLAGRGDFLHHAEDARDWNAGEDAPADKKGKSDRFVLRFVKP